MRRGTVRAARGAAPRGSRLRPVAIVALLALGGTLTAAETASAAPDGSAGIHDAPATAMPDTIQTRADSVRARVLERLRTGAGERPADTTEPPPGADPAAALRGPADPAIAPTGAAPRATPRDVIPPQLPQGADSIMRALVGLPGYNAATYSGTRADFTARDRRLTLSGTAETRARFSGQGTNVEADSSIVYDETSGRIRTVGPTLLTPREGEPVRSSSIVYDLPTRWATARDAETTYAEGQGNWFVRANQISAQQDLMYGTTARFTSCDHDPPHSYFEADQLKIVADRVLVARNVRLYFDNVPVAWLPFIAQPMSSGRQSGILTPRFSVNDIVRTSDGRDRRISNVGYFWAMSDYSDVSLAMDWWSNQYTALTGSLRYRWARQFLQGDVSMRRFWRDTGARDFALSTRNRWEASERTRVSVSGNYVTNTGLVRQNSLDPRELTSSIDSNAGVQHRFDWGNLSVSARRQQYLSDDRLEMTLPNASLSLSTRTLFAAPPQQARWFNNVSVSGSTSFSRDVREFPVQPDTIFRFNRADQTRTQARVRGSMGVGNLNLSSQVNYRETLFPEVPAPILQPDPIGENGGLPIELVPFSDAAADWNLTLGYQQRLMGTSTLTPSLSLSGNLARVDSIPEAADFISAPTRVSFGMNLRTELFGFYPGVAGFEAIRHKLTPGLTYSYSPATQPTSLQEQVFGSRNLRVQNQLQLSLNQTFEARVQEREEEPAPVPAGTGPDEDFDALPDDPDPDDPDTTPLLTEEVEEDEVAPAAAPPGRGLPRDDDPDGPRRAPQSRVVTLLGLNTSAVAYDLVQADSTGRFLDGFITTRVSNTIRSDYLRGLSLSFAHSLFEEPAPGVEGAQRSFAPHLEQLSLSFSMDNRSGIVRRLGDLVGIERTDPTADTDPPGPAGPDAFDDPPDDFGGADGFDENRVIPGSSQGPREAGPRRQGWDARFSYSLRRPRDPATGIPAAGSLRNQMLSTSVSFQPTPNWDATWQTTYDLEENRFNDHILQLRRDLHEWEASFGFRQTANGNWTFQFDVSLRANRDLRFDYEQRNVDGPLGPGAGQPFE